MACPAIWTGNHFLWSMLGHIDCQAQAIGSYGYGALADPASAVSIALSGLLTLFVALLGLRMMLGYPVDGRDIVGGAIRIGIVLVLATSWPAWRVIGHDMVLEAPSEIARTIGGASGLPNDDQSLRARLQYVDDGLVAMTMWGTGRMAEPGDGGVDTNRAFRGIALSDDTGFGWGRVLFLTGTIGPQAIVRLGAGVLLALAPLMAGLLLFGGTIGLFMGWVRGLAFCALGGLALFLIQSVELAILIPWVGDVVAQRGVGALTPAAPTELIVLALAFCALAFGALFLIGRVAFQPHQLLTQLALRVGEARNGDRTAVPGPAITADRDLSGTPPSRAYAIGEAVAATMRREESGSGFAAPATVIRMDGARNAVETHGDMQHMQSRDMLGSSYRHNRRSSATGERRDRKA